MEKIKLSGSRSTCDGCIFGEACTSKKITGCPCMDCLIKGICTVACDSAIEYFNKIDSRHRHIQIK